MNSESGSSPGLRDYLNTWELQQLHSWISELQAFSAELQARNAELLAACEAALSEDYKFGTDAILRVVIDAAKESEVSDE